MKRAQNVYFWLLDHRRDSIISDKQVEQVYDMVWLDILFLGRHFNNNTWRGETHCDML